MYKFIIVISAIILIVGCNKKSSTTTTPIPVTDTGVLAPKAVVKTNAQKVYVHYMPWFEDTATSGTGKWGQHWTMANENPGIILANGRRQIASYFYPMIGPYASSDLDVIDYHFLLMKYSGIDGIIVDWYGTHNVHDYPLVKRNTDSLFNRIPAVGLQFGICYEDATLANDKAVAGIDTVTAAKEDFTFLASSYFTSKSYITINNEPLLLCFGPQGMKTTADWQNAFSVFSSTPTLLTLEYDKDIAGSSVCNGEFAWVQSSNLTNLNSFYSSRIPSLTTSAAAVYPGFQDFYAPGGWGSTLFLIPYNNTSTLQSTIDVAKTSNASFVQLITWNDYGEGTMIEPTLDFNFTFLETIQQYTGVTYTSTELQLIYKWYTLRKKYKGNATVEGQLTQAYYFFVSLDVTKATNIINSIS